METIILTEEEPLVLPIADFDQSVALQINNKYKNQLTVGFPTAINPFYTIRSNGYVGYLPVDDQRLIRILPKVSAKNVFKMFEYTYNLKSFGFLDGIVELEGVEDLFERLMAILARQILDRNRIGLFRDYITREEDLPNLKGRANLIASYSNISRGSSMLNCVYQDQTVDIGDNQILAWTMYVLSRIFIRRVDVRYLIRKAYRELSYKVTLRPVSTLECENRNYHRLNNDYRPMHALSRFFLELFGPSLEWGDREFLPYFVYMPSLFESFVAEWLNQNLPHKYHLQKQCVTFLDPEARFNFRIDLVISEINSDQVLAVLDTKYKSDTDPIQDIQQIVAYAVQMRTNKGFLIYPSKYQRNIDISVGNVNVKSLPFDISGDLDADGQEFLSQLFSMA